MQLQWLLHFSKHCFMIYFLKLIVGYNIPSKRVMQESDKRNLGESATPGLFWVQFLVHIVPVQNVLRFKSVSKPEWSQAKCIFNHHDLYQNVVASHTNSLPCCKHRHAKRARVIFLVIGSRSIRRTVHSNDLVKFLGGLRCTARRKLEIYNLYLYKYNITCTSVMVR